MDEPLERHEAVIPPSPPKPKEKFLVRNRGGRREAVWETRHPDRTVTRFPDGTVETRLDAIPTGLVVSKPGPKA